MSNKDKLTLAVAKQRQRTVVTPEGVSLQLPIASEGDRIAAFVIDFIIITIVVTILTIVALLTVIGDSSEGSFGMAFTLFASFLVRNFYFMWFELYWNGSTPGKRFVSIRVVDRRGGNLSAEAIVARNLTRDIETFLPLAVLIAPQALWPDIPAWGRLLAGAWLLVFMLLPLFNHDRLRIGDLIAGTLVIKRPKTLLLEDLGAQSLSAEAANHHYTFKDEQLTFYGIYELQVLEDVLRRNDSLARDIAISEVCEAIKKKIGWPQAEWQVLPEAFLQDFYAAQRARLESKMLLGKKKASKYDRD